MTKRMLENVSWYLDPAAAGAGAPGIWNSFVSCLCAALGAKGEQVDPIRVMGDTGWAFRVLAHKDMCPSAMSVFDWTAVLTESVEQVGYDCQYVSRYWHEDGVAEERRRQAHELIVQAIDRGDPAIVWDVPPVPEWGLIVGYDDSARVYHTLGIDQNPLTMPYDTLGKREIPILSVTVLAEPNNRADDERAMNALRLAVRHGLHQEWLERPDYQDGPEAFDVWAEAVDSESTHETNWDFAQYYAGHYAGARVYAAAYLQRLPEPTEDLVAATRAYVSQAALLGRVYAHASQDGLQEDPLRRHETADLLRQAGQAERQALNCLERFLADQGA